MKLILITALKTLLFLLLPPAAVLAVVLWYSEDSCGNETHAVYFSTDKAYQAIVFQRSCGATTGFSTQISIIKNHQTLPNSSGNIYIIAGHPQQVAPDLEWLSNNKLLIKRSLTGTEFKAEQYFGWLNEVEVVYGTGSG